MSESSPKLLGNPWRTMELQDALAKHAGVYDATGITDVYLSTAASKDPKDHRLIGRLVAVVDKYPSQTIYALNEYDPKTFTEPVRSYSHHGVVASIQEGKLVVSDGYTEHQARVVMAKAKEIAKLLQPYIRGKQSDGYLIDN